MKISISFVILTYNSEKYVERCILSVLEMKSFEKEIIVVDNGSVDKTKDIMQNINDNSLKTIFLDKNYGTTYSRNIALKERNKSFNYVCILDSDTVVNEDAFIKMIKCLNSNDKVGLVGPSMVNLKGIKQISYKRFPSVTIKLLKAIPFKSLNAKGDALEQYKFDMEEEFYIVDYLISACWLMKNEVVEKVGFLDEKIFYAPEDCDYCLRVWKSGYKIAWIKDSKIIHDTQRISKKKLISKINLSHIYGLIYYFNKHKYMFKQPVFKTNDEPERVLVVIGKMHFGGIETMIMNFYRNIDRSKIQFDFLLNYREPGEYDNEIRSYGGKLYYVQRLFFKNIFKYISELNKFFKEHKEYKIVHGHLTSVGVIYMTIARLHGVKTTILHAHTTSVKNNLKGFVEKIARYPLRFCSDYLFACSNAVGQYMYGKGILNSNKYTMIKNAINTEKFNFNEEIRRNIRSELNISDNFVIVNVGRFEYEKNHNFIIEIFNEIYIKNNSAKLMLIGMGSLEYEIKQNVDALNLTNAVMFMGKKNNVHELLQGADVFLLPSLYEGLPVVGVEAQAVGLKCFLSSTITHEVDITGLVSFLPLEKSAKNWANEILKYQHGYDRQSTKQQIIDAGYDIYKQSKWLEEFYLNNI